MSFLRIASALASAILLSIPGLAISQSASALQVPSPPPSPPFTLLDPVVNEITYTIEISNSGGSSASFRADIAVPRNWPPDTYVEVVGIRVTAGETETYASRGNSYLHVLHTLPPRESAEISVTFVALKYALSVHTHNVVIDVSHPNDLDIYTQSEAYIESNDSSLQSVAAAIVGGSVNPFRIAEKLYSFTLSHLRYVSQEEIKGALWALSSGEGDCTEYSTLFVALMRAVGIPARTVTGHAYKPLSSDGAANATGSSTGSPHMWAEFFVKGYGWVPADPSSGRKDPLGHLGVSGTRHLPVMKGQILEPPYRSLFTLRSAQMGSLSFNTTLLVTPLSELPFNNQATLRIYDANLLVQDMRLAADSAYEYDFNVTGSYGFMREAFHALLNASDVLSVGDIANASRYATLSEDWANQALQMISASVMEDARSAVNDAWKEMRTLGALSGERYLDKARHCESEGDYAGMVVYAHYAKTAAEDSASIFLFVTVVVLSVLVTWVVGRNSHPKGRDRRT